MGVGAGNWRKLFQLKCLALPLLLASGVAWGQSEEEITAAVGKERDAYTQCLKNQAIQLAKTEGTEEEIADKAVAACTAERASFIDALSKPPIGWTEDDAAAAVDQSIKEEVRPRMLADIRKARS